MQVNVSTRLKRDSALPTPIFLCSEYLQSQSRVGFSADRSSRAFSPVVVLCRVVWAVATTDFDIAGNGCTCRVQQRRCCCSEYPVSVSYSFEVSLFHPFAWLVWMSPFYPLPYHLPVAMSDITVCLFSRTMSIVVSPSTDNWIECPDDLLHLCLFIGVEYLFDSFQMTFDLLLLRLCQECPSKSSDGEAQEIKSFIPMNDTSFVSIQNQPSFFQECLQLGNDIFFQYFSCGGCCHKVVGVAYQTDTFVSARAFSRRNGTTIWRFTAKQSFHSIQCDVCQQWTNYPTLRCACCRFSEMSELDYSRFEPSAYDFVKNGNLRQQRFMRDVIKTSTDVRVQNPRATVFLIECGVDLSDSVHTVASWSKSIRVSLGSGFPFRFQGCFHDSLHHPVFDGWDAQRALFAIVFRDVHSSHWHRAVSSERPIFSTECHSCFWGVAHHSIYTWRMLALVFLRDSPDRQELIRRGSDQEFLKASYLLPFLPLGSAENPLLKSPYILRHVFPLNVFPARFCLFTSLFNEHVHRLTSLMIKTFHRFPFRQDQSEVCILSDWVSPALRQALSARLLGGFRFFRHPLPSAPSPFLAVGIPPFGGMHRVYPVDDRGVAYQLGWSLSPGGASDVAVRSRTVQPVHLPFWSQRISLLSLSRLHEVYRLFTVVQPSGSSLVLGRLRLAAFGTLSPRLQTSVFTFACSGRDTRTSRGLFYMLLQYSSAALFWTATCTHRFHTGRKRLKSGASAPQNLVMRGQSTKKKEEKG